MTKAAQTGLMHATEIALQSDLRQSSNGVRYTAFGENNIESADLDRIVQAVPATIAAALGEKAYYFVPLALIERPREEAAETAVVASTDLPTSDQDTMIATTYTVEFSDRAICHRNVRLPGKRRDRAKSRASTASSSPPACSPTASPSPSSSSSTSATPSSISPASPKPFLNSSGSRLSQTSAARPARTPGRAARQSLAKGPTESISLKPAPAV